MGGRGVVTFDEARQTVAAGWPDYRIAPYGFETGKDWLLILLPETAGGRIPAVSKATGAVTWINENSDRYRPDRPVGVWPERRP